MFGKSREERLREAINEVEGPAPMHEERRPVSADPLTVLLLLLAAQAEQDRQRMMRLSMLQAITIENRELAGKTPYPPCPDCGRRHG